MLAPPSGKRILSGIQPSGGLHLGNYFGALRQHVALQETNAVTVFVADYHSMTSITDPAERIVLTRDVALDYLAFGLDPERSILYRQSDLPEVQGRPHQVDVHLSLDHNGVLTASAKDIVSGDTEQMVIDYQST